MVMLLDAEYEDDDDFFDLLFDVVVVLAVVVVLVVLVIPVEVVDDVDNDDDGIAFDEVGDVDDELPVVFLLAELADYGWLLSFLSVLFIASLWREVTAVVVPLKSSSSISFFSLFLPNNQSKKFIPFLSLLF